MSGKYTAGPWCIETPMGEEEPWIVEAGKKSYEWRCLAIVCSEKEDREVAISMREMRANAALIAAAPCLYKALAALEPHLDAIICYASDMGEHEPNRLAVEARAALAKARGEA